MGPPRWHRLTEGASGSAKSVARFEGRGRLPSPSALGCPGCGTANAPVWPFDGWQSQIGASVILEVYPKRWSGINQAEGRTQDQHDAYSVVSWLQEADRTGCLDVALASAETEPVVATSLVKGWILDAEWPPMNGKLLR